MLRMGPWCGCVVVDPEGSLFMLKTLAEGSLGSWKASQACQVPEVGMYLIDYKVILFTFIFF